MMNNEMSYVDSVDPVVTVWIREEDRVWLRAQAARKREVEAKVIRDLITEARLKHEEKELIEKAEPIQKIEVDQHTSTLIYFQKEIEGYGEVRIQTWSHGIEVWIGGEKRCAVEPPWVTDIRKLK